MADQTNLSGVDTDLIKQVPDYPVDGNGNPVLTVAPGKWGKIRTFRLTLPGENVPTGQSSVLRLVDAILFYDSLNPTNAQDLPARTLEIAGWLLLNHGSRRVWLGGIEVQQDLGIPLLAEQSAGTGIITPGSVGLTADLGEVYGFAEGEGNYDELSLTLIGRGFEYPEGTAKFQTYPFPDPRV